MTRRNVWLQLLLGGMLALCAFGQTMPRPADELLINTVAGGKLDLKTLRGKVVAVEMLLTTCSHCQASARVLQGLSSELKAKGFEVVGAAVDVTTAAEAKEAIPGFVATTGAQFPVGWISSGEAMRFLQHPAARNLLLPQLVLVDRRGNVVYQHTGEVEAPELRAEIDKILAVAAVRTKRAKKAP
jgi:glutathione peroxidase-family protein